MNPQWFKYLYLAGLFGTCIVRILGMADSARNTNYKEITSLILR